MVGRLLDLLAGPRIFQDDRVESAHPQNLGCRQTGRNGPDRQSPFCQLFIFSDAERRARVKNGGVLTRELLCRLYNITSSNIITFMFFDPALAFKFTLRRIRLSKQDSVGERDTFGAQQ